MPNPESLIAPEAQYEILRICAVPITPDEFQAHLKREQFEIDQSFQVTMNSLLKNGDLTLVYGHYVAGNEHPHQLLLPGFEVDI